MFRSLVFVAFVGASYGLTLKSWGASSDSKLIFFIRLVPTRIFSLLRDFFLVITGKYLVPTRNKYFFSLLVFFTLVGFGKDERKLLLQKYF